MNWEKTKIRSNAHVVPTSVIIGGWDILSNLVGLNLRNRSIDELGKFRNVSSSNKSECLKSKVLTDVYWECWHMALGRDRWRWLGSSKSLRGQWTGLGSAGNFFARSHQKWCGPHRNKVTDIALSLELERVLRQWARHMTCRTDGRWESLFLAVDNFRLRWRGWWWIVT